MFYSAFFPPWQKYGHVTVVGAKDPRIFYHTKTWWFGFFLAILGEAANFVSYAFAPLSLVAPLNAVSILSEFSFFVGGIKIFFK